MSVHVLPHSFLKVGNSNRNSLRVPSAFQPARTSRKPGQRALGYSRFRDDESSRPGVNLFPGSYPFPTATALRHSPLHSSNPSPINHRLFNTNQLPGELTFAKPNGTLKFQDGADHLRPINNQLRISLSLLPLMSMRLTISPWSGDNQHRSKQI